MGSEVGAMSTSLGLYASSPLILSTESVVVMEWCAASTGRGVCVAIAVLMPFNSMTSTDSVESMYQWWTCVGPQRGAHPTHITAERCEWPRSRGDAAHGLFAS